MKLYFIVFNLILVGVLALTLLSARITELRLQAANLEIRERQLAAIKHNYAIHEENIFMLQDMPGISPLRGKGEILMDAKIISEAFNLHQLELSAFFLDEYAGITETQATIAASGRFEDISKFLHDLSEEIYNIQIRRVQISEEAEYYKRLRLTFSIFE